MCRRYIRLPAAALALHNDDILGKHLIHNLFPAEDKGKEPRIHIVPRSFLPNYNTNS